MYIRFLPRLTPTNDLYTNTNTFDITKMTNFNLSLLIFKIKNNLLKNNIDINEINQLHQHETRYREIKFNVLYLEQTDSLSHQLKMAS